MNAGQPVFSPLIDLIHPQLFHRIVGPAYAILRSRMTRHDKLYEHIMLRRSDANVSFEELRVLLRHLGFDERIRGSHHIFTHSEVQEILNLQTKGKLAKPYQVKQVRELLLEYRLTPQE